MFLLCLKYCDVASILKLLICDIGDTCSLMAGQYPGEKEITFPPFTCLEADDGPRVEHYNQGEVVIFPLKV